MSLIQRLRCSAYIELVVHRKRCGNLESIRPRYRNARSIRTTVYTCSEPANGRRAVSTSDLDRANFIGFRNGNCLLPRMLTEYRINPPLPLPVHQRTIKSNSFRPLRDNSQSSSFSSSSSSSAAVPEIRNLRSCRFDSGFRFSHNSHSKLT